MTQKLYWDNETTESKVEVLHCEKLTGGGYCVYLNATPFHPQGGGQPTDTGRIGEAIVSKVEMNNNVIVHYTQQAVALGSAIARVDVERRQQHSRLHSAGHLIGHALQQLNWQPVKAHHWPREASVTFKPGADVQSIDISTVQKRCDELIARNLPRRVCEGENLFRQVSFGDLQPYGCGGTHVAFTLELKGLQILSVKLKKGLLIVQYDIQ